MISSALLEDFLMYQELIIKTSIRLENCFQTPYKVSKKGRSIKWLFFLLLYSFFFKKKEKT